MADLIKGTYTYRDLANKYGNFYSPAVKVKVGGDNVLNSLHLAIPNITVQLSLESAGMASFQIAGAYNEKSHSFDQAVKDKFELGTTVEIELGYLSSTTLIFKGTAAVRGTDFSGAPSLSITLMDARKFMMEGSKSRYYDVKHYSDAFDQVIKDYKKLCTAVTDATDEVLKTPVTQNGNDYDFIVRKLIQEKKVNRQFFILGDKAYFRKPAEKSDIIMTLEYGRELLSFSQQDTYGGIQINVTGYDEESGLAVKGSASVGAPGKQKKAMAKLPEWFIAAPGANTEEKAKKMAAEMARRKKRKGKGGSAEVIGLPELVPGRYIKVAGMDSSVDGTYFISGVSHRFGSSGFQTSLELEGEN